MSGTPFLSCVASLWSDPARSIAVFDNLRVLHGRSAYSGSRRLCGAYVNGDDYRSRLRGLRRQFGGGDPKLSALRRLVNERYSSQAALDPAPQRTGAWADYL